MSSPLPPSDNADNTPTTDTGTLEQEFLILRQLETNAHLPPLPPMAATVLRMSRDEETEVDDMAALIQQDPAMVARLLHVANSSYYGGSRHHVTGVAQAITLLGMQAVGTLAFSLCVYRLMSDMDQPRAQGMDHAGFWRRSIFSGLAGRAIAEWSHRVDSELAFISALLQDIGLLGVNQFLPELTGRLVTEANGDHMQQYTLERAQWGCDHAAMGQWIASSWNLPAEYQLAIRWSHEASAPETTAFSPMQQTLIRSVAVASDIADLWCHPDTDAALRRATLSADILLGIGAEPLCRIITRIPHELPAIAGCFQVHLGDMAEIDRVLEQVQQSLAAAPSGLTVQ